ncbi:MAG TPA: polysaccharide biosynthesis tyrosine autokinase [Ignavibacteriaceae bacterium]|nr:polysaccharide biosynthesis tyrosine autokinase [Ignavibacteriaceae bacterium]
MDKFEEILNTLETENKEVHQNYLLKFTKHWYWFAIFAFIGIVAGFVLFHFTAPSFLVQSKLLIPSDENAEKTLLSFDKQILPKNQKIENQIGTLQSFSLYKKALENLNWKTSYFMNKGNYKVELYESQPFEVEVADGAKNMEEFEISIIALNDQKFKISGNGKTRIDGIPQDVKFEEYGNFNTSFKNKYFDFILKKKNCIKGEEYTMVFNNINSMTRSYLKKVKIILEDKESELVNVQVISQTPKKDADFINELNQVFITSGIKKNTQTTENSLNFIDTSLVKISNSLKNAEVNLSNYRRNNQVVDLGNEANVIYQKLEEIENEKYLAKLRIDYYKNMKSYIGDANKMKQMINPSIIGITDVGITTMLPKLMDLYSKREVLSYSVEPNNPSLILLEKEIQLASNSLSENLNNLLKNSEIEMQSLETRYNSIQQRLTKLPETERNLISIQRDFNLNNELYTYMLQKKAEASISLASNIPQVQIIDPAMVESSEQIGPSLPKNIIAGFGLGLFIPFIIIVLADAFNTKLESAEDVEKHTKLQILDGIIHSNYKNGLPVINNPHSGITESFRILKVNLKNFLNSPEKKVLSVNSLVPGEGKTFISANLSTIFSLGLGTSEKKVLLIEGDLRKPKLNILFGDNEGIGLSSYLANKNKFSEVVVQTPYPNLYFIPAGEIPPNPTELLENGNFDIFIKEARAQFDYIIIDNAPVSLVSDGLMTSKYADSSIFIVRLNYSKKKELKEINKVVSVHALKNALIVLNDTSKNRFGYGNKYWKNGYGNYLKLVKTA